MQFSVSEMTHRLGTAKTAGLELVSTIAQPFLSKGHVPLALVVDFIDPPTKLEDVSDNIRAPEHTVSSSRSESTCQPEEARINVLCSVCPCWRACAYRQAALLALLSFDFPLAEFLRVCASPHWPMLIRPPKARP
jgi:hypothetical protein